VSDEKTLFATPHTQ